jgi:hypothetical protein
MAAMTPDDVLQTLVEECREGHVGLWRIVNAVRFDLGSPNPAETRAVTLRLVRSLLQERGYWSATRLRTAAISSPGTCPRSRRSIALTRSGLRWGENPTSARWFGSQVHSGH